MRKDKKFNTLIKHALLVLLLLVLTGCSSENDSQQALASQTEIDQLQAENEKLQTENRELRKELDAVLENFAMQKRVIEVLESDRVRLEASLREQQAAQAEMELTQNDTVPPQLSSSELLVGEWVFQKFVEDGRFSFTQSLIFNANGSGMLNRTYYVPKKDVASIEQEIEFGLSLPNLDESLEFSWNLDGEALRMVLQNGEIGDFIFLPEQQKIYLKSDEAQTYGREMPSGLEDYVERSSFAAASEAIEAKRAAVKRKVLGSWYFDALVWTFNDDGTGVIDIPELGDQPATKRTFSYETYDDPADETYLALVIDWDDSRTSYFLPAFNADGSMTLQGIDDSEPIKLTRTFDINNCPISTAIIENGIGVLSGSMFYDILPGWSP